MKAGIQMLPPKTAAQFAERARNMEGCVRVGGPDSDIYEFAQGSTVVTLMLGIGSGHIGKDPRRADEIRKELAAQ